MRLQAGAVAAALVAACQPACAASHDLGGSFFLTEDSANATEPAEAHPPRREGKPQALDEALERLERALDAVRLRTAGPLRSLGQRSAELAGSLGQRSAELAEALAALHVPLVVLQLALGLTSGIVVDRVVSNALRGRALPPPDPRWSASEVALAGLVCAIAAYGLWKLREDILAALRALLRRRGGREAKPLAPPGWRGYVALGAVVDSSHLPPRIPAIDEAPQGPPPGPKGKGKGKGLPPPMAKAGKAPPTPKGKGASAAPARPQSPRRVSAAEMPFGQRIHLVQPVYDEPAGAIFRELSQRSRVDKQLMSEMFSPGPGGSGSPKASRIRQQQQQQLQKICLLDSTRATNLGIVLSRLRMSTEEICKCVNGLDFSAEYRSRLQLDDIELVSVLVPNAQEKGKLLASREKFEQLRDVEQSLLPLCDLSAGRLRVMKAALSWHEGHAGALKACLAIQRASEEAKASEQFKECLGVTLQMGNIINEGEGTVRGFAIESLHVLASFKRGGVSAMHYLCLTMMQSCDDSDTFLQRLLDSLRHVHDASRERRSCVEADVESFASECRFVEQWAASLPEDDPQRERMDPLAADLAACRAKVTQALEDAKRLSNEAQMYFSVVDTPEAKLPPWEQFFGHLDTFLVQFQAAWCEIASGRGRWKAFASKAKAAPAAAEKPSAGALKAARAGAVKKTVSIKPTASMKRQPSLSSMKRQSSLSSASERLAAEKSAIRRNSKVSKVTKTALRVRKERTASGAKTQAGSIKAAAMTRQLSLLTVTRQMSVPAPQDAFWNGLRRQFSAHFHVDPRRSGGEADVQHAPSLRKVRSSRNQQVCEFHIMDDSDSDSSDDLELGPEASPGRCFSAPSLFLLPQEAPAEDLPVTHTPSA